MEVNSPRSGSPISGSNGKVSTARTLSHEPITKTLDNDFNQSGQVKVSKQRSQFIQGLTSVFGFKKKNQSKQFSQKNIDFVSVDSESELRIAQAKIAKTMTTKLSGKLGEMFDAWLHDTAQTYNVAMDREKRISELEYAINNDPFLSQAASLYGDEATQLMDNNGKLIEIECSDPRMKERMEDLIDQWGITQNRLRSAAYNLAAFGDAFWSNKVTKNGVVRCIPLNIHQIKERLEFNPVQVQADLETQKGFVSAINRHEKLKKLFDNIEGEDNEEFSNLFDTRLFGFVVAGDLVVPPWAVTHFRLNSEHSPFFPMGESVFLKALAPYRMLAATQVLQSLARVMSFPVTVYEVATTPGMDEAQQFEKINEVREEYENIGESAVGNEAYSVNTKLWAPKGLMEVKMHSPNIDINAVEDMLMYTDRVAIASGIPKGYLIQEYGGFGNSAISLVEQFKPFARKVFTVQSSILDGLSDLFRLHFAITGEFDYREDFILSMKFPNEESSDTRNATKTATLNLSKDIIDTVANLIGSIDDPLPPEVIQDILSKFSFLDPKDIKKWIRPNPNQVEHEEDGGEEFDSEGDMGGLGGGDMGGGMPMEGGDIGEEGSPEEETTPAEAPDDFEQALNKTPESKKRASYIRMEKKIKLEERNKQLINRYKECEVVINEEIIKTFKRIDESTINGRHYKFSHINPCNLPMYELFQKNDRQSDTGMRTLKETIEVTGIDMKEEKNKDKLNWGNIKADIANSEDKDDSYEGQDEDAIRTQQLMGIIQ